MKRHALTICLLLAAIADAVAQYSFTPLEQQKISIETPALFERSDAFTVDFAMYGKRDYSFPLPVGTAKALADNEVEITTKAGDAVKAMFGGTVRISWQHPKYGWTVVLRHENGLETVYAHNRENRVKVGEHVEAGQTIAIVGGTEGRTYCLFSVMVNGCRINPHTIVALKSQRLLQQTLMFRKKAFTIEVSVVEPDPWDKQQASKEGGVITPADPFGGAAKFTLNLASITPEEWRYPLPGAKVISPFGARGGRRHSGVDLKTKAGDNILAAFDGVVIMSQVFSGYGNCVIVRHATGLETLYSHNVKNLVKVGQQVKAGQVIALTGRTGRATTEHLHFECRVNGKPFNPNLIFNHTTQKLNSHKLTFSKNGAVKVN